MSGRHVPDSAQHQDATVGSRVSAEMELAAGVGNRPTEVGRLLLAGSVGSRRAEAQLRAEHGLAACSVDDLTDHDRLTGSEAVLRGRARLPKHPQYWPARRGGLRNFAGRWVVDRRPTRYARAEETKRPDSECRDRRCREAETRNRTIQRSLMVRGLAAT